MARSRKPAEGERAAIGGYYPQYLLSSDLILRGLDEGRLEWIRLADPEAGRLDDFQIATPARLDAYQFKWAGQPGAFNYSDLIQETRDAHTNALQRPSLIAQLADGWQRLRAAHPARRVVVHLVTNDIPGPNPAKIPLGTPPPARRTFASFLSEGWAAARIGTAPARWQPALDELRALTGLDANDFVAFLRDCEMEFGASLPSRYSETLEAGHRWENLQGLVAFMQRTIQAGNVVELPVEQLLRSLGWEGRYASRFRHEFPDPRVPYRAIVTTERLLEDRIAVLRGGYLAVVGPPGSGKSVLLTKALRRPRAERVVRYYAYVPDAQDPAASRGESVNFLHDVCLSLQRAGVSTEGTHLPGERELLLGRFHRQLALLGEEYRAGGPRTILLIDGLDHIDRELRPTRSLLADLPRPDQVPDGVFLLLGSQTDQVPDLSDRIRHALDREGRRIRIDRMDRASVRHVVENAGLPFRPTREHLERVFDLSGGHPLALNYLIQSLRGVEDEGQVAGVLARAEPYLGDIEAQYRTYWQAARNEAALMRLLSAVARLRGGIDLRMLASWFGDEAVRRLVEVFARYFVEEPDRRWRFFHNSFRVFLARETSRDYSGRVREEADRQLHRDLAERLATEPFGSPGRWEELYHRVSAGDHEGVCRIATQAYFREQVFALRPLDAVRKDIEIAIPSAAERDDVRAYAALTLSQAELSQRERLLGDLDLPGLLLDLDEIGLAVEAARDGNRLRVGVKRAMELATRFDGAGEAAEAGRLFELAEPLDLLASSGLGGFGGDEWRVIDTWAATAPRFRPIEEVLDILAAARLGKVAYGMPEESAEARLRVRLLQSIGFATIATSRWADLEAVLARIPGDEDGRHARFWLLDRACKGSVGDHRRRFADRLREEHPPESLTQPQRLHLADLLLRHLGDEPLARELLEGLPLPIPDMDRYERDEDFRIFDPLLLHASLLYRLGDTRDSMQMVPDGPVADRAGRIWFLRDVVAVARVRARSMIGPPLVPWEVRQAVSGIMQRFNRSFRGDLSLSWSSCRQARVGLYRRLVRAVAGHGPAALHSLRDEFERQWQDETSRYWPAGIRLQVALAFAGAGEDHRGWAIARVGEIEERQPRSDLHDLVRESQDLAGAWISLGRAEDAARLIRGVVREANGVAGEDYQLDSWLDRLDRLAAVDLARATGMLDWFAGAVAVLNDTAEGRVASSAARRLIQIAARLEPGRCVSLSRWLMDRGVVDHPDRVKSFLEGIVESPGFPARTATYALADLVVPFDTVADEDLARSIVLAVHRVAGRDAAGWAAGYLMRRVATFAMPTARDGWIRGIRDAAKKVGLTFPSASASAAPSCPPPEDDESEGGHTRRRPPGLLVLEDEGGSTPSSSIEMSLDEVLTRGAEAEALAGLARREHYTSNFDWAVVADRVGLRSPDQLRPLVHTLRQNKRRMLAYLLSRSRSCLEARNPGGAWDFASLALEITDRFGWSRRYSDGGRFDATRALIDARPADGRRQLWRLLVGDAGTDPTSLEEAVSQLRDVPPTLEVWPEVEEHLRAMFDERVAGLPAPDFTPTAPAATVGTSMARMLLGAIDHPVAPLSRAARRACVQSLLDGDSDMIEGLGSLLGDDPRCRAALEVLDAATRVNDLPDSLREGIGALTGSRDALVAMMARDLAERGGSPPSPAPPPEPLPAAYTVALPDQALRALARPEAPAAGEPWPDTGDPRQLLAVVARIYRALSRGTGIPKVTLLRRGAQLMREVDVPSNWSAQGEQELHRRLEAAGLLFTYRRPRSDAAFRATSRLIGELWHAGRIPVEGVRNLVGFLRMCDPALALAEPLARPAEVPTIPCESWGDGEAKAWVDAVGSALPLLPESILDGRVVLAETSRLEAIGRGLRYETRLSVVCEEAGATLGPDDAIATVSTVRVRDYAAASPDVIPVPLIIRHSTGATDENPASEWIALNPEVGRSLGWSPAPEGLFRWTDPRGRTMAESLWWSDGPVGRRGMLARVECVGEGWLVVADPSAVDAIVGPRPGLRRVEIAERGATLEGGGEATRSARQSSPWPASPPH